MFSAEDVNINEYIPLDKIFSQVSEYDIFRRYCKNFTEINKDFESEFYADTRPSCRIYQKSDNKLYYKDFGTGEHLNCFDYIKKKFNCKYIEALRIIVNDFNILKIDIDVSKNLIIGSENESNLLKKVEKPLISIVPRNWTLYDYNYWTQFGITFDILDEYDVIPCDYVYLHKSGRTVVFKNSSINPIYAYRFTHDGKYSYKIYKPLEPNKKYKWLFSGGNSENIEGFDQLPLFDDLLIITKSLKDVISCRLCGYSAISLQGEANKLSQELVNKLQNRFKRCILFYDNDEQGLSSAGKISRQYGFKSIIIPQKSGCKDLSEYIREKGLNQAKRLLKRLINGREIREGVVLST